jgi:putative colanic acid biosynthesis acetyltransferase WcaF
MHEFKNPHSFANKVGRILWRTTNFLLCRWTPPRLANRWRILVLRAFGAKLGNVWIHPSARIWAPWRLIVGDDVAIDMGCYLYNPDWIIIEDRVVVSMNVILCTPSHDYSRSDFPLLTERIVVESDCWIAAQSFIQPGVRIGRGAVVGAGSMVTHDVPPWTVVGGNPAVPIKERVIRQAKA